MKLARTRLSKIALSLGLLVTVLVPGTLLGASPAQATESYQGCPAGGVCIYPNGSWNSGHPSSIYYYYASYNLSNMYGTHRVFNNQTDNAVVSFCTGWNGTNCFFTMGSWTYTDINLTPVNSIKLMP